MNMSVFNRGRTVRSRKIVFLSVAVIVILILASFIANPPRQYEIDQLLFASECYAFAGESVGNGASNDDAAQVALRRATKVFINEGKGQEVENWRPVVKIESVDRVTKRVIVRFNSPTITFKTHLLRDSIEYTTAPK
jgi:hypothetical protein